MPHVVTSPPSGALTPIEAAAKFHRKLWRRYQTAEKALAEFDAKPPPVQRKGWLSKPESPRDDFRQARPGEIGLGLTSTPAEQRRALVGEVRLAIDELETGLIALLKTGEIIAYVIPAKLADPYLIIKPGMWEKNLKLSLFRGTVTGNRFAKDRILVVRNGDLPTALSTLPKGRPEHPLMEEIMTRYWETVPNETDEASQIECIRLVLLWAASQHPKQRIPSPKTVSSWIKKKKYKP